MVDVQQEPLIVAAGPRAALEWVDMGFASVLSLLLEEHAIPMEDVGPDAPKTLLEAAANPSAFGPKGGAVLLDVARALLYEAQCVVDVAAPNLLNPTTAVIPPVVRLRDYKSAEEFELAERTRQVAWLLSRFPQEHLARICDCSAEVWAAIPEGSEAGYDHGPPGQFFRR